MRSAIRQMLKDMDGQFVSGEEISRRLNVSRTAVWKHIQALKEEGYDIEGHSRRGYRLRSAPDLLLPEELCPHLTTERLGRCISYLTSTDSTNNAAKRLAADGCPEGQIVVAEEQVSGRGRLARGWFSPFGKGVWFSIVLRPPFSPQEAPKCTLLAAVAVSRAIRRATGVECGIKWPNDILVNGRKLVGILTEMSAEMDAINYIVIGMGINVNVELADFPPELQSIACSLTITAGRTFSRVELLAAVLSELERLYDKVIREGFTALLDEWREESVTLGQAVDVIGGGQRFSGVAEDIDSDGALLVRTATGLERVLAGDVSIRPQRREE